MKTAQVLVSAESVTSKFLYGKTSNEQFPVPVNELYQSSYCIRDESVKLCLPNCVLSHVLPTVPQFLNSVGVVLASATGRG